jgi:DNA-binding transcriptional ArsR family regulator
MSDKVILDDKSFKALSANSRVSILKRLTERRMTLSELSKRLSLRNSTVKEHCNILLNADLITKIDEGRKWKYYELTGKGKQIVQPSFVEGVRVLVTLCLGAIIFGGILLMTLQGAFITDSSSNLSIQSGSTFLDSEYLNSVSGLEDTIAQKNATPLSEPILTNIVLNYNVFSTTIITVLVLGIFIGWLVGRKSN